MLAKHSRRLAASAGTAANGKAVNLVSFTPGTSFEMGWRTGKSEERAMLHLLLVSALGLKGRAEKSSRMLLQRGVKEADSFTGTVQRLRAEMQEDLDPVIAEAFATECRRMSYLARFEGMIDDLGRRQSVPSPLKDSARELIADLRHSSRQGQRGDAAARSGDPG